MTAPSPPAAGAAPVDGSLLTARVARAATDTAAIAVSVGEQSGASLLTLSTQRLRAGAATVVVVGEKKRGKSSLLNALLGREGLLPVDVDVATNVHLTVGYAEQDIARATVAVPVGAAGSPSSAGAAGGPGEAPAVRTEVVPIDLADLAEYAAVDPARSNDPARAGLATRDNVLHVDIGLPDPLLRHGLRLVDTPGVGGLVAGHARAAAAAASAADALLFVVSGQSELTASEHGFLRQLRERTSEVLFVLAQIDKYPDWRNVLARNQELIRDHAPALADAPWFPVSSRFKIDADRFAERGRADRAATLTERSGFVPLMAALTDTVADRADRIRMRNTLHATGQVLDRLEAGQRTRLRSLAHDPALLAEINDRRTRLAAAREETAWWRAHLAERFQGLDNTARLELSRLIADLQAEADERIVAAGTEYLAQLPRDLAGSVGAIWMTMQHLVERGLAEISGELGQRFEAAGMPELSLGLALPDRLRTLPTVARSGPERRGLGETFDRIVPSVGLGTLTFTLLSGASLALGPVAPVVAGVAVVLAVGRRRIGNEETMKARADARRYVSTVSDRLRTELPPVVQQSLRSAMATLRDHVTDALTIAISQLEEEIAEHNRTLRRADEQNAPRRTAVTNNLNLIENLRRQTGALRTALDGEQ
ncbi:dynamin family protein [Pseudofrankia inefficax]|uniref:GTP-binding protein HSR1-related protein n=1 Tax=Pseudofrankia inefficax (strain DSM 45817 / CECT 9037 / DDB 130130 / EuI1c) TaxID=298654 RepID=E3IVR3_PSEI1|nr:dynamin family protein [Pseudofrankia inefficax]ADP83715.1 GTP-binding protein HSR1-related protein [Pseudofrankia inefficax]